MADLAARRVRFIGEARQRIREDYLRILRFFRLTAEYGEGPPDAEGLAACVAEREGLARLSAERVRQEMLRLLAAPRGAGAGPCHAGLRAARRTCCPPRRGRGCSRRLAAIEAALGLAGDAILRLAALAVELPEDADRLRERLRLSNEEHARLVARGPAHARHRPGIGRACGQGLSLRRRRGGLSRARADGLGALGRCAREPGLARAPTPSPSAGSRRVSRSAAPTSWRSACRAGPRVGELLRALEAWWIAGDFAADETALRAELQQMVAQALTRTRPSQLTRCHARAGSCMPARNDVEERIDCVRRRYRG